MGFSQEAEDLTPEERQQDYIPKTFKEEEEYGSSPFHEEKPNNEPEPKSEIGVESQALEKKCHRRKTNSEAEDLILLRLRFPTLTHKWLRDEKQFSQV